MKLSDIKNQIIKAILWINKNSKNFNADNRNIGVRWNKEEANYSDWNKATNGKSYFHRNPKDFINKTKEKDFLTLAWQPYQRGQEAVKFSLNSQNWKEDIEQSIKDGCSL